MDTTAEGILGIDLEMSSPGAELRVVGAHLDGIPAEARQNFRAQAGSQTIGDLTSSSSGGMTVRAIQEGHGGGLFGSRSSTRVRIALQSRPGARTNLTPVLTGTEGMFIIDRVRQRFSNPEFGQRNGPNTYDYDVVPIGAAVIWAREIAQIRIAALPNIDG